MLFNKYIKPNNKVLDIGFGSGRDLKYIQNLGVDCYGVESCKGFLDNLKQDKSFENRLFYGKLPGLRLQINFQFDENILKSIFEKYNFQEIELLKSEDKLNRKIIWYTQVLKLNNSFINYEEELKYI